MIPVIKMSEEFAGYDVGAIDVKNYLSGETRSHFRIDGSNAGDSFVITAEAFRIFLKENNLRLPLSKILDNLNVQDFSNLQTIGKAARQLILENEMPHKLAVEIKNAHYELCGEDTGVSVTVKSNATPKHAPSPGFLQQLDTVLNVGSEDALINAVHKCYIASFTDSAIKDRMNRGINTSDVEITLVVQKVSRNDLSSPDEALAVATTTVSGK